MLHCVYSFRSNDLVKLSNSINQENQVLALKEKGIAAEYLSSTQTSQLKNKVTCWNYIILIVIGGWFSSIKIGYK